MLKNLWNILPLPRNWNDEERKFGVRISDALVDLFRRFTKSDKSMATIQGAIAIFANGNTHPAIGNGKYVYVVNHGTLEEGLYKATSAIAENATLSLSNLTPAKAVVNTIPNDSNLVHKTGAETITGGKTFKGAVKVQNGANNGIISFSGQSGNANAVPEIEIVASHVGREYDRFWNPNLQIKVYSTNSDGEKSEYCEYYELPLVDNNLAGDMWYSILTTKESLANNLTTEYGGQALDARQGKALNDGKLDKGNVYNGLDKTDSGFALDARQGKVLNDKFGSIPTFKSFTIGSGTHNFAIAARSRIRIDLISANAARMGYILVAGNVNGNTCYQKSDVGSGITVSTSGGNLVITPNNDTPLFCTIYAGDISAAQ